MRVTIDYGNLVKPSSNTFYKGPEFFNRNIEAADLKDNTINLKFVESGQKVVPESSNLYIFSNDTNSECPIIQYEELFFDPNILKILLDLPLYLFLKKITQDNPKKVTVSLISIGGYHWNLFNFVLFVVLLLVLYRFCRRIITKLSKMDPIFTDFNIVSSNIQKFRDVSEKIMPQCTICFEEFNSESDVRILDCKHYFHPSCIDRWLIGHSKKCPCCRSEIVINEKV